MEILLDALVALLSCIGIWTLWRMLQNHLFDRLEKKNVCVDKPDALGSCMKEANTWKKQKSKTKLPER